MSDTRMYKTWVEVNGANLIHNLHAFEKAAPKGTRVMAVIKAGAYGHGLPEVAGILAARHGTFLGVDSVEEAQLVRKTAKKDPIMILGYIPPARLSETLAAGFHISVYSPELLSAVKRIVRAKRIPLPRVHIHLKIETGTNRLGIPLDALKRADIGIPIEGIYTHFADSEDLKSGFAAMQYKKLETAKHILREKGIVPKVIHSACTAAVIRGVGGGNLIRLGIGLYGLWPSAELKHKFGRKLALRPALAWKTRIAQIKEVASGETVGYDRTWGARRATRIAILPVGYYDGYDRRLSNRGDALVNGKRAPIVGRICMNMSMIDIGNIPAKAGDEVVLLGASGKHSITADDMAKTIGTINYEVVSRINPLLPRVAR